MCEITDREPATLEDEDTHHGALFKGWLLAPALKDPSRTSWQLHTSQVALRQKDRGGILNMECINFLLVKYAWLTQDWHSILWVYLSSGWKKKIRNHGFCLHKLFSYCRSFYSESSPTHSLPSPDLFTLDFSAIWNFYRIYNIGQQMSMEKKMGGSSFWLLFLDTCYLAPGMMYCIF